ncbi:MAG: hypothetical protein ACR2JN_11545 [Lapillicoccus sp.]
MALRGRHGEHFTDGAHSLSARCLGQVVVAVPSRLLGGVGNELKDPPGTGRNFPACEDNARDVLVSGHAPIEALDGRHRAPRRADDFHDLRHHGQITAAAAAGATLADLPRRLGHSSAVAALHYLHTVEGLP